MKAPPPGPDVPASALFGGGGGGGVTPPLSLLRLARSSARSTELTVYELPAPSNEAAAPLAEVLPPPSPIKELPPSRTE